MHGECYVTDDELIGFRTLRGERLNALPPVKQTMLLGRIYLSVVKGKKESFWETVQVVPHIENKR
jgi:CTP synthase (UTP-ammonia lyase)